MVMGELLLLILKVRSNFERRYFVENRPSLMYFYSPSFQKEKFTRIGIANEWPGLTL